MLNQRHQKCFHLKYGVYECDKFRKLMTFSTRNGKCVRNSNIDLTKSSGLKKLTESHSENEIEKESPVREAKMLLYWVTTTTIFVLYYKYFSYPMYSRYFKHYHFSQFNINSESRKTQCKINFTFQSQKPPNFKVALEW